MAKKSKERNLFDLLQEIFHGKTPWEELSRTEQKNFSVYMINRFISMDMNYTDIIAGLQKYTMGVMTPEMVYKMYQDVFPKRKFFQKYIKPSKKVEKNSELVDLLSEEMQWSKYETETNLDLLSNKFLTNFLTARGFSEKEIKKKFKVK